MFCDHDTFKLPKSIFWSLDEKSKYIVVTKTPYESLRNYCTHNAWPNTNFYKKETITFDLNVLCNTK